MIMEFYSERCSDWLDKNHNIHPDKLAMEIQRFENMLNQSQAASDTEQQDHIDDLQLTIQLLQERLTSFSVEPTDQLPASAVETAPMSNNESWDTSSLTGHGEQATEVLDPATRAQRKKEILNIPGIQLASAGLKTRPKDHAKTDSKEQDN